MEINSTSKDNTNTKETKQLQNELFTSRSILGIVLYLNCSIFIDMMSRRNKICVLVVRVNEVAKIVAWEIHSLLLGCPLFEVLTPCLIENLVLQFFFKKFLKMPPKSDYILIV